MEELLAREAATRAAKEEAAALAERSRLARELHDEMGQSLSALRAEAAVLQARPDAAAGERIGQLSAQLLDGLQAVLDDLRPPALDRFGLLPALLALVAMPRRRSDGSRPPWMS